MLFLRFVDSEKEPEAKPEAEPWAKPETKPAAKPRHFGQGRVAANTTRPRFGRPGENY